MINSDEIILEEMQKLIIRSCACKKRPSAKAENFHTALLKFFLKAVAVEIDYESCKIEIFNSKPLTTNPLRLFDINEAIADTIWYSNLEETLLGCLESGKLQENFYKKLLFEYRGNLAEKEDFMSA